LPLNALAIVKNGKPLPSFAFAKAGCHTIALEPDPSALVGAGAIRSLSEATNIPIEIVQSYGETLPFDDNTFDIVYGRAVMHHARDLNQFCKEVARVLKPGGVFIGTREHVISKQEDIDQFLDGHALHKFYGGENAFLLSEYTAAITGANLQLKKTIAPSASVINFAPATIAEFQAQKTQALSRFVGPFANLKALQNLYIAYCDNKSNSPGRHYSFLGVKP
jgi:ubiquinone/menaquinone biosynthesis C-methylase UbiE